MGEPVTVGGAFAVNGGTYQEVEIDIEGKTLAEIVGELYDKAPGVSLCHQCAAECSDPELGDLYSITVGDQDYVRDAWTGQWIPDDANARTASLDTRSLAMAVLELLTEHGIPATEAAVRHNLGSFVGSVIATVADDNPDDRRP